MKRVLFFLISLLAVGQSRQAVASCAATPVAAARLAVGESLDPVAESPEPISSTGFRAAGVHWDPLLQKLWFRVLDCKYPERPAVLVPVSLHTDGVPLAVTAAPQEPKVRTLAVHAGQTVDLLYEQGPAKIHLRGISEANGYIGDRIVLRPIASLGSPPELRLHASVTAEGEGVLLP
ncbi:hypothetical protein [Terriglobus saanensis]|uniref:Flagella basal body P-ring formation protein FlgA C-terminal domain-containing protein n=1 Tax=Terriglobus saanensis (strain ATCC BAA-1853 / DSM 23119 / SP1PR4) TaxID=401053 RepID=E8V5N0_TERSS|nr:hypothetical protein [Terriglobus saanensis]ADV82639.1 hypothetical protein AciPR4_1833 [Terriglobus saanensis SP1PR4]